MANRIRVVLIIPSLTRGGAERQMLAFLRGLDRSRFNPTLVLFENLERDSYDSLGAADRVLSLDIPAGGNFRLHRAPTLLLAAARLARILRQLRPDILHTFLPAPAMVGCIAARLASVPIFIVGRRSMVGLYRRNSLVLSWIDRLPLLFANAIVGNCKAITAEATAVDGVDPSRAFTVYNGVDTHLFHEGREPSLRHELGFTDKDVIFGVIANFDASKGHIDLIRAAHQLQARAECAKFLMVGADKGQLASLRSEILRLGMERKFVIQPRTSEPERLLRLIDVYVCASVTEGMSNSVLEAMASGKPIIATAVGGNPELVTPVTNGFLVPPRSPEAIAVCIENLCRDADLRAAMGLNGRRIATQRFSTAAMVRASEDLYLNLVSRAEPLPEGSRTRPDSNISFSRY